MTSRNYGFITPLIGKPGKVDTVSCHKMAFAYGLPGLLFGSEVSFDLVRSHRGVQAANVRRLQKRKVNAAVLIREETEALKPVFQRSHP
jgi:cold shock CspA family protein